MAHNAKIRFSQNKNFQKSYEEPHLKMGLPGNALLTPSRVAATAVLSPDWKVSAKRFNILKKVP